MPDTFKIYTRKHPKAAHAVVEVTIDWSGISEEDLRTLARNALVHNLHAEVAKMEGPIPERMMICAAAQVHRPPAAQEIYDPARLKKPKVEVPMDDKLRKALSGMSKDELKELFGMVN